MKIRTKQFPSKSDAQALFLDRDGTLNRRLIDNYVTRPEDFVILPGVLEALAMLSQRFEHIFMVTNQQGIGKGLMTEADLKQINNGFLQDVQSTGGRIDQVYFCPSLKSENSFFRKPNIGMALQAKKEYPSLVLKECVMVGDTKTDMMFGHRAGMTTVLVGEERQLTTTHPELVDFYFETLLDFARFLLKK